ncbi:MAG: resolvase [Robiginitomaculum sp.]|nr:MAG: resolvase [Robiginitomaculum sp.]
MYQKLKQSVTGVIYSYVRTSRHTQRQDRQILRLKGISDVMVTEKVSADSEERPKFDELLAKLKNGDMLIVLDLDRAFRDMITAILVLYDLQSRGVQFKILNSDIDLDSELGKLMYIIKAHYAESELNTLRRRTREGLAAARKRGVRLGRPHALNDNQVQQAYKLMKNQKMPIYKVARKFGVAHSTLALSFERMGFMV